MNYLFILGRNPELSGQEVLSYFRKEQNKVLSFQFKKNSMLVELEKLPEKNIIENFGGILSIGKVIEEGNLKEIFSKLENRELYFGRKNKLNYVIWNFSDDNSLSPISDYLKQKFRSEKLKATEKPLSGFMTLQEGKEVRNLKSRNIDEEFFIFGDKKMLYFGKIVEKCDYEKIELRDMQKPVRRSELSISPRLAKIMINLSETKKYEKLLDSFCGVGTILQEALLQKIDVIGIDRDREAIEGCSKNMEWFNFPKKHYRLINNDSAKFRLNEKINAIVTEPDLGKILARVPTDTEAKKTLENLPAGKDGDDSPCF